MANLTRAQRHNRMLDQTFERYYEQERARKDFLPTITDYTYFLETAVSKLKISKDEARNSYGQYTYGQWKELLKLF